MPEESPTANMTTALRFHPLTYLDEGSEVTVGRVDNGTFVMLPADAAQVLRRLESGATGDQASRWYRMEYGEELDLADFIEELAALGFLVASGEEAVVPTVPRWHNLARAIFSPAGAACYLLLLAIAGWLMATSRSLLPRPSDLFFAHYLTLVLLAVVVGQLPLTLLHEGAHALAARRLGLPSQISLGRRLYYVVFETNLDSLVSVPRRKRYLPMLAGILADLAGIACLTIAAEVMRTERLPAIGWKFLLALSFLSVMRIAWQFWIFLQTDIYHLVATVNGCVDLHATAKEAIRNRMDALRRRPPRHDPEQWHPRDRATARWYAGVVAAGYAFCTASVVIGLIPALIRMMHLIGSRFTQPHQRTPVGVLDVLVFFVLSFGEFLLAGWLALRERRRSRRSTTSPATSPVPAISASTPGATDAIL